MLRQSTRSEFRSVELSAMLFFALFPSPRKDCFIEPFISPLVEKNAYLETLIALFNNTHVRALTKCETFRFANESDRDRENFFNPLLRNENGTSERAWPRLICILPLICPGLS